MIFYFNYKNNKEQIYTLELFNQPASNVVEND